jgi:type I restriction enzyme S subunit
MAAAEQLITDHLDLWTSAIRRKSAPARGSSSKVELYGIKKLRQLILELAVRGLLVPQCPDDEPATELVKKIAAEKAKLVKDGKVQKENTSLAIRDDEKPFALPLGWEWCRLTELAYSQAGFAFKSNAFNEAGDGLPLIRIRDVGQEFSGTYYNGEYRKEFLVQHGDYLISMDGNFRVAPWTGTEALLNQRVSRLIFHSASLGKKFVAASLQLRLLELQGTKAYTTVDHLSGGQISESVIALPPLAEQHRVAATVDDLMALCEELEQKTAASFSAHQALVETLLNALTSAADHTQFASSWRRIAEHFDTLFITEESIDQFKQTILQLAVMGKLVPQDPNDEPASETYSRMLPLPTGYRRSNKQKIRSNEVVPKLHSPSLPDSWTQKTVDQLYSSRHILDYEDGNHGSLYPRPSEFSDGGGGVLFLTAAQIASDGMIAWDECQRLSVEYANKLTKGWSRRGDVYFTHNATVGRTAIAKDPPEEDFLLGTSVTFYRINGSSISAPYLYRFLSSPEWYRQAAAVMQQTTRNQVSITKQALFTVSLPPLAEQDRIAKRVDELIVLCDQLKSHLRGTQSPQLQLANAFFEQALARA